MSVGVPSILAAMGAEYESPQQQNRSWQRVQNQGEDTPRQPLIGRTLRVAKCSWCRRSPGLQGHVGQAGMATVTEDLSENRTQRERHAPHNAQKVLLEA